jgi:hypothetical protein
MPGAESVWAVVVPVFDFSVPKAIDRKPLAFLFEQGRVDLLKSLVETTMGYRELVKLVGTTLTQRPSIITRWPH